MKMNTMLAIKAGPILLCASLLLPQIAQSQTQEIAEKAHFELQTPHRSGWITIDNGTGQYIYGDKSSTRRKTAAILFGRVERDEYTYFSAQEEEALWDLLQKKLITQISPVSVVRKKKTYQWPKVTVQGIEICVPTLDKSEDENWKDHLTCVEVKQ
ncbi:MAG: hypothetical protein RLY14_631 [Planctomycetota bacterium]|jgi:hypothetical protein